MGHNTNGYLAYGFYLGNREDEYPEELEWLFREEDGDGIEERTYDKFRKPTDLERPTADFPDLGQEWRGGRREPTDDEQAVLDAYSSYWKANTRVLADAGVQIMYHGYENSSLSLIVNESFLSVEWGETADATKHSKQFPDVTDVHWRTKLILFCDLIGIPYQEPTWLLACSYD